MHIAIIGGGIIGLGAAWRLADAGADVVLFEREGLAQRASRAAAGMISPVIEAVTEHAVEEHSEPGESHERGQPSIGERLARDFLESDFLDIALRSRDLWSRWSSELALASGRAIEYDQSGALLLAFDSNEAEILRRVELVAGTRGETVSRVDSAELRRSIPDLDSELSRDLRLALHLPGEHRVHSADVCAALECAASGAGARLRSHEEVLRVDATDRAVELFSSGGRNVFDAVVVAGGPWSGTLEGLPRLPVRPVRGQLLSIEGVEWPWSGSLRTPGAHYAVRRRRDELIVGATVEDVGFDDETTDGGLAELSRFVERILPGTRWDGRSRGWSGLRPATEDRRPLVGKFDERPLFYATGHYRNGVLLAPWTSETVADWIINPSVAPLEHVFSPARYAMASARL